MKRCKQYTLCHDVLTKTIRYCGENNYGKKFLYKLLMDLKRTGDWERVNAVLRMQEYIEKTWAKNKNNNIDKFKSYFRSSGLEDKQYKMINKDTKIILFTHDWLCFLYAIIKNINCTYQELKTDGYNCSYTRDIPTHSENGGGKKKLQSGGNINIKEWKSNDECYADCNIDREILNNNYDNIAYDIINKLDEQFKDADYYIDTDIKKRKRNNETTDDTKNKIINDIIESFIEEIEMQEEEENKIDSELEIINYVLNKVKNHFSNHSSNKKIRINGGGASFAAEPKIEQPKIVKIVKKVIEKKKEREEEEGGRREAIQKEEAAIKIQNWYRRRKAKKFVENIFKQEISIKEAIEEFHENYCDLFKLYNSDKIPNDDEIIQEIKDEIKEEEKKLK